MNGLKIGIDFGDTQVKVAHLDGIKPRFLMAFPSQVSFLQNGGYYVGEDSRLFGVPENTVIQPITILGQTLADLQVLAEERYAFSFFRDGRLIRIDAHRVYPTIDDVFVAIFEHAKKEVAKLLGREIDSVVIAIPDGANDVQRIAISKAAEKAGLPVKQLLNQNTASALGFRFDLGERRHITVIDVGASHTSCSQMLGGNERLSMLGTRAVNVGTNQMAWELAKLFNSKYQRNPGSSGNSLLIDSYSRQGIIAEAALVLPELNATEQITMSVGGIGIGGRRVIVNISRQEFERAIIGELSKIQEVIQSDIISNVDTVLLVGGGANVPAIRRIVDLAYHRAPFSSQQVDPTHAVCLGASIKAGILDGVISSSTVERTVNDLGTFYRGNMMDVLIPRGTIVPYSNTKTYRNGAFDYTEKVYQWTGLGSGQDKLETDPHLVVLANKRLQLEDQNIRITFSADASMVATFIVTEVASGKQHILTGFNIN